jgi:hypothetical protein
MSYGADFAHADPANAPLDPVIMIGADPFVWGAILLIVLAVGLIGWMIGHYYSRSKVDAAEAIWTAVNDAVKEAMKASTEALPDRAGNLQRVLQYRLGKTLKFVGELAASIKDLDAAIKGEIEDKTPAAVPAAKAAAGSQEAETGAAAAAAAAAATNVTIVSVCPQPSPAQAVASAPPAKPEKRPMTTTERNDALRLAVAKFDDYWRHKKAREDNIRDVVAELTNPGPRPSTQPLFGPAVPLSGTTKPH